MATYDGQRAVVIGGSIGGLTIALLLRDLGFAVDIYERAARPLAERGGGIIVQPETLRWFRERSSHRPHTLATSGRFVRYLGPANEVLYQQVNDWAFTSWSAIYGALLSDFGTGSYHLGHTLSGLRLDAQTVQVQFEGGKAAEADLVVCADGISSTARRLLLPQVERRYAHYVGWRGAVPENTISTTAFDLLNDALTYSVGDRTHMIIYPIPGPNLELRPGRRSLNYVWYRNVSEGADLDDLLTGRSGARSDVSVPPGQVQERYVDELKHAAPQVLAPAAAEIVVATRHPYIQPIFDIKIPRMTFGRIALIGDAAFVARPHPAAGTAKAAEDAWTLASALEVNSPDIPGALLKWEVPQLELGSRLVDRAAQMGERSQSHNTWVPGDPNLGFGLHGPPPSVCPPSSRHTTPA
jgi:2,6-dihydroxypyridine 3-monooxygenase